MIKSWRKSWGQQSPQRSFPFYVVQISAYGYNDLDAAARLREAQQKVADKVKQSGLAVTIDLGDMNDIHYSGKKEVGRSFSIPGIIKGLSF